MLLSLWYIELYFQCCCLTAQLSLWVPSNTCCHGFSTWAVLLHLGRIILCHEAVLCFTGYLAASLVSTSQMPVAFLISWRQTKISLNMAKCPLEEKNTFKQKALPFTENNKHRPPRSVNLQVYMCYRKRAGGKSDNMFSIFKFQDLLLD